MIGTTLAHYRITAALGAGGMGEVWRATDTKLGREVALKVLPEVFAGDSDRLARFEREAKVLASLNHPNIAHLYGLENLEIVEKTVGEGFIPSRDDERAGINPAPTTVHMLVMELVEGDDLSERIKRGPISVDEALPISLQIAEALEAAHEAGIVHRDLKPANIKLTEEGVVKVLDFGLAKTRETDSASASTSMSPTLTWYTAVEGVILGTAPYMSPEQARGKKVDRRTDIWAFGVVLCEMLTGRRLFEGETVSDVLAAIINYEPDLDRLPPETPPWLRKLVGRCLIRDPRERLRDVGEARIALRGSGGVDHGISQADMVEPSGAGHRGATWGLRASWLVAIALGIAATVFAWLWLGHGGETQGLVQSVIESPPGASIAPRSGFALSPDGRQLAFAARDAESVLRLWVRSLDSLEARELPGTEGAFSPFWSPDSRDLCFFVPAADRLMKIPASGGQVQFLAETTNPCGGTWGSSDRIVYAPTNRGGLFEVSSQGGDVRELTQLESGSGELSHRWPLFLADGKTVIFLAQTGDAGSEDDRSRVKVVSGDGDEQVILYENTSAAVALPDWLLFWRQGSLFAQKLDMEMWRLIGDPRRVADNVGYTGFERASFSVGPRDTLVYHRDVEAPWRLEWRSRRGRFLANVSSPGRLSDPVLSPDGGKVAYVEDRAVWIRDLVRDTTTRLTFDDADHYAAHWSPDGTWLVYSRDGVDGKGGELVRRRSWGVGEAEVLHVSDWYLFVNSFSKDGRLIAFDESGEIKVFDLESGAVDTTISPPGGGFLPSISPDGTWLAFHSALSGRDEVYVVPVVGGPQRWQVSSRGGLDPEWGPNGDELFFLGFDGELRVAGVDVSGPEPTFGTPEPLFSIPGNPARITFEVARDGRILVLSQPTAAPVVNLTLVQNWPALVADTGR